MFVDARLLNMTTRRDLCLKEKINLIKEKENGFSHRQSSDKFQISLGSVSNILKRKLEYTDDYQLNRNKKIKTKIHLGIFQISIRSMYFKFLYIKVFFLILYMN